MKTTETTFTFEDKVGFFLGTIIFLFTLPLSFLLASIPIAMIGVQLSSSVASAAIGIGILGIIAVINLVFSMILGLAAGYGLCWSFRKLRVPELLRLAGANQIQIETQYYTRWGALAGGLVALLLFLTKGHVPLTIVTERVEHLFPAPLVLNLGQLSALDLSHTYAVVTGFLTVGFLFSIAGIVLGSLTAVLFERLLHHTA
jgi:hypothetical protein